MMPGSFAKRLFDSRTKTLVGLLTATALVSLTATAATSAPPNNPVVIANGWSTPDVGTAAPLAGSLGGSVLYAERNGRNLGAPTVSALRQLKPSKVILVGGSKVLTSDIVDEVRDVTGLPASKVERLSGSDRLDTAAKGALYTLDSAHQPTTSETSQAGMDCPADPFVLGVSGGYERVELRCANFRNAELDGRSWTFLLRDLRGADFSSSELDRVVFAHADLRGANLSVIRGGHYGTIDSGALVLGTFLDLTGADLRNANLRGANLAGSDLRYADLRGANLLGSDLRGADLRNADLRGVQDLDSANFAETKTDGCQGCP